MRRFLAAEIFFRNAYLSDYRVLRNPKKENP